MSDFEYLDILIEKANKAMGKVLTTKDRKKLKAHFEGMSIGFVRVFAVIGK